MKKLYLFLLLCAAAVTMSACASSASGSVASAAPAATEAPVTIDLDLSNLSGTVAYSQVYNIMMDPEAYVGKVIRMAGWYDVFQDYDSGATYFSCIIPDATACCAQGIEFVWKGDHAYPDDYPELGTGVTVTGRFETYMEDDYMFVHLVDSDVVWDVQESGAA